MSSQLPELILAKDGLLARSSGEYVKRKLHFLRNYCGIVATGMKKWSRRVYVDAMAGPGVCVIRQSGEEVHGSPLVALEHEFTDYVFAEENSGLCDALSQRVARHPRGKHAKVVNEDWRVLAQDGKLDFKGALVVAFVDPTGISQVPWKALHRLLTANSTIDLLMTVQHSMGIKLNANNYASSKNDETALTRFLGDASTKSWKYSSPTDFTDKVLQRFLAKVGELGFAYIRQELVTASSSPFSYRFVFCSRHSRGDDFWKKITRWSEKGQKEFLLE